jgi:hypothetical protein
MYGGPVCRGAKFPVNTVRERRQLCVLSLLLLWIAGFVQVAMASANLFLPVKLNYL